MYDPFKPLPIDQRQCRLLNENPLPESMFKFYIQKSCQFECAFTEAKRISRCVPFSMPHLDPGNETICTREHVTYFEANMTKSLGDCDCLPDCEGVTFNYRTNTVKLDPDHECEKEYVLEAAWENVNTVSDQQAWRYDNIYQALTDLRDTEILGFDVLTRCKRKVKPDFAEVIFEIGNPDVTQMIRSVKFTPVAILTLICKWERYHITLYSTCMKESFLDVYSRNKV